MSSNRHMVASRAGFVGAMVVAVCVAVVVAEPPTANLGAWAGRCYNCYNYAVHSKRVFFAQPGGGSALTCAAVSAAAVADGLTMLDWTPGDAEPTCPTGFCLVALSIRKPNPPFWGGDYHWYRKNADGTWSQKRGGTPAITTHVGVGPHPRPLTDPSDAAQRGSYKNFCGYFCVPTDPQDLDRLHGSLFWGPLAFLVRISIMDTSGLFEPGFEIPPDFILPFLPTLDKPLPDPGPPFGPCYGYSVEVGNEVGLPYQTLRVKDGIVEVRQDYEGTLLGFFQDDQGLEAFLQEQFGPCITCNDDNPCPEACPWDCGPDFDGIVGIVDFLALLGQWGQVGTSCDFDGTGVGIVDFLKLLGNWGPCP